MPACHLGTKGTVHVTADREIVVILEGHAEALREGACERSHRIGHNWTRPVSRAGLKRAFTSSRWAGRCPYDNAGSDAVGLLRPASA